MESLGLRSRSSLRSPRRALRWAVIALLPAVSSLAPAATIPDDPASKAAFGAMTKLSKTPHHQYVSTSEEGSSGAKQESELISTDTTIYIKVNGKWQASRMTPKDWEEQEKQNISNAKAVRCEYERDETVNGEATAVYKTHTETDDDSSDAEIWVSKRIGLPLRMSIVQNKTKHMSMRFDYANIQAPPIS
jgi:outer membrane lipoprotein-sorting protein